MKRTALGLILSAGLLLATGRPVVGEVFVLSSGGRVTGRWLNREESPREKFVLQTAGGGRITLERSQVKEVLLRRPEEVQYEKIRSSYPDTVEGQWALAEWCRGRRLSEYRTKHLERIVQLDPDHTGARRALGHSRIGGAWTTRKEKMIRDGYKLYKGRWRTSQEIELMEDKRKIETAQKEWAQKLKRWRGWLFGDKDPQGRRNILAIDDPQAVKALARALEEDGHEQAKLLYVMALAKIGTPEAIRVLAVCSLEDPIEEVRLTCLDHLKTAKRPQVVAYYVDKLRDKDNRLVKLAAVALGQMKDLSAVGPLVDALVTTHKFKIVTGSPGSMSTTFGTGPGGTGAPGGSGMAMGGGPKIIGRRIANQPVLDALVVLTGQNFNFDQQAWKYWHASQRKRESLNARRD